MMHMIWDCLRPLILPVLIAAVVGIVVPLWADEYHKKNQAKDDQLNKKPD